VGGSQSTERGNHTTSVMVNAVSNKHARSKLYGQLGDIVIEQVQMIKKKIGKKK